MPRMARVVVPGIPHHVIQRGNRRQNTFFGPDDYRAYLSLMAEWCKKCGVEIWAYCLMTNHVHLIAVPREEKSLRQGIGEAHKRYTRMINFRKGWRGHLWQERFKSYPLDDKYLLIAARYIEQNPVAAGLCKAAGKYRWSSAKAHLIKKDDVLVKVKPLLERVREWREFLYEIKTNREIRQIRRHERTGRPLGSVEFVMEIEKKVRRILHRQKPGPKPVFKPVLGIK